MMHLCSLWLLIFMATMVFQQWWGTLSAPLFSLCHNIGLRAERYKTRLLKLNKIMMTKEDISCILPLSYFLVAFLFNKMIMHCLSQVARIAFSCCLLLCASYLHDRLLYAHCILPSLTGAPCSKQKSWLNRRPTHGLPASYSSLVVWAGQKVRHEGGGDYKLGCQYLGGYSKSYYPSWMEHFIL